MLGVPIRLLVVAACAWLAGFPSASGASTTRTSTFTCSGTPSDPGVVPPGTYRTLAMPAGSACEVNGAVAVASSVLVDQRARLEVKGGGLQVAGSLTLDRQAAFVARAESAPVEVAGLVTLKQGAAFLLGTETPNGPPFASIGHGIRAEDASAVVVENTTVGGPISVLGGGGPDPIGQGNNGGNRTTFRDDHVDGSLSEVGYDGAWAGLIRTVLTGSLEFAYNAEATPVEYDLGSNIISGSAFCAGNDPPPNVGSTPGAPSIVHGPTFGSQAKTCTGVPGGGTGPPG